MLGRAGRRGGAAVTAKTWDTGGDGRGRGWRGGGNAGMLGRAGRRGGAAVTAKTWDTGGDGRGRPP